MRDVGYPPRKCVKLIHVLLRLHPRLKRAKTAGSYDESFCAHQGQGSRSLLCTLSRFIQYGDNKCRRRSLSVTCYHRMCQTVLPSHGGA